jgi:hypothetical protein
MTYIVSIKHRDPVPHAEFHSFDDSEREKAIAFYEEQRLQHPIEIKIDISNLNAASKHQRI